MTHPLQRRIQCRPVPELLQEPVVHPQLLLLTSSRADGLVVDPDLALLADEGTFLLVLLAVGLCAGEESSEVGAGGKEGGVGGGVEGSRVEGVGGGNGSDLGRGSLTDGEGGVGETGGEVGVVGLKGGGGGRRRVSSTRRAEGGERRDATRTYRDCERKDRSRVPHRMHDLPVRNIVYLDHLVQPTTQQPSLARSVRAVERQARHRLLMIADLPQTSPSTHQIPTSHHWSTSTEDESSRRVGEDSFDRVVGLKGHFGVSRSRVPEFDRRVVGTCEDLVRRVWEEGS